MSRFRVVTYNVHKCRGLDGRVRPTRIASVLHEVKADIVALQEVLSVDGGKPEANQARYIAESLGFHYAAGETRALKGGSYGNVVLSRFPVKVVHNHDLSVQGRERRSCLHTDIEVDGMTLHIFNVHLGTDYMERRHQGRLLTDREIVRSEKLSGARIVLGDFNEWIKGLTTELLGDHLQSIDIQKYLRRSTTYPGVMPFMHLDHIYYAGAIKVADVKLHRTRLALMASDHLPLIADFQIENISSS